MLFGKTLTFVGLFGKSEAGKVGDALLTHMVQFDPEAASEAQLAEFEKELDEITAKVAQLRAEYTKENDEATVITDRLTHMLAAAENLKQQVDDPANAGRKAELEGSLGTLLSAIEELSPQVDQEKKDAADAKEFLDQYEQAARDAAQKLTTARQRLQGAQRQMERAHLEKERANDHAEQAAQLAGLRSQKDSMGIALGAMTQAADKDHNAAVAMDLKSKLLAGAAHPAVEQDANIAKAMDAATNAAHPPMSLTDRLNALKAKNQPVAA